MANSFLKREVSTGTNQKTWTVSAWIKMSRTGVGHTIFGSDVQDDGSNYGTLSIEGDGLIKFINLQGGSLVTNFQSNRKLVDLTSFYHIVLRVDTTQGSAGDRIRIYINGIQETSWAYSTNSASQNADTGVFKSGNATLVGTRISTGGSNFEGNIAHMHIISGQSHPPSVFGETDSTTGEWKPKLSPTGITYDSANSAFLKFENAGALGTDSSGQSNTFAVNGNLKQSNSTTSNLFPIIHDFEIQHTNKILNAGTSLLSYANNTNGANCTMMVAKGKWYFEVKSETDATNESYAIQLYKNGSHAAYMWRFNPNNSQVGRIANGSGITYLPNNTTDNSAPKFIFENSATNYGVAATANDIVMCALDLSGATAKLWFGKNGTWHNAPGGSNVGVPHTGAYPGLSFAKGDDFWGINISSGANAANNAEKDTHINFGTGFFGTVAVASANEDDNGVGIFEYDVPAGFYAICTKNIKSYG